MRVMIDTNVLISAVLFPSGRAAVALAKAMVEPCESVVSDYVVDEPRRKFREKFPDKVTEVEAFLYGALSSIEVVATPIEPLEAERAIRDVKDRPILRAALDAGADLFSRAIRTSSNRR